jgi:hypothetical protein
MEKTFSCFPLEVSQKGSSKSYFLFFQEAPKAGMVCAELAKILAFVDSRSIQLFSTGVSPISETQILELQSKHTYISPKESTAVNIRFESFRWEFSFSPTQTISGVIDFFTKHCRI